MEEFWLKNDILPILLAKKALSIKIAELSKNIF